MSVKKIFEIINKGKGVIEEITPENLLLIKEDSLNLGPLPDVILTVGDLTDLGGNEFEFGTGYSWRLGGNEYENSSPITVVINPASEGFYRIDVAYVTNEGEILIQEGEESEDVAVEPSIPTGTLKLRTFNIFGDVVSICSRVPLPFDMNILDILTVLDPTAYLWLNINGLDVRLQVQTLIDSILGGSGSLFIGYFEDQASMQSYENPVDGSWGFFGVGISDTYIGIFKDIGSVIYDEEDEDMEFPIPVLDFFTYNISNPFSGVPNITIPGVGGFEYSVVFNGNGFSIVGQVPDYNGILQLGREGLFARNNEPSTSVRTLLKFEKPIIDSVFTIPNETGVAASREYVNNLLEGLKTKQPVRVATTASITLSGTQTIDGVALSIDDRVLVKDNSTQSQNGIYLVKAGAWLRTDDANTGTELTNAVVSVLEGTANTGSTFRQITTSITLGSSNIVWQSFGAQTPDATSTTKGKAKLYNELGTNTDGAVTQNVVKTIKDYIDTYFIKYLISKPIGNYGTVTGTTAETVILSIPFLGGEFEIGNYLGFDIWTNKSVFTAATSITARAGTTGTTADNVIAILNSHTVGQSSAASRRDGIIFETGNFINSRTRPLVNTVPIDVGSFVTATRFSLNPSVPWFLTFTVTHASASDEISVTTYSVLKRKSF